MLSYAVRKAAVSSIARVQQVMIEISLRSRALLPSERIEEGAGGNLQLMPALGIAQQIDDRRSHAGDILHRDQAGQVRGEKPSRACLGTDANSACSQRLDDLDRRS